MADIATTARVGGARRRKRAVRLSTGDRVAMAVMVGIPVFLTGALIWFPTISSIGLSFTDWDGIGGLDTIEWTGTTNYQQIATIYPPFWPAFRHNLYWLAALAFVGTPLGMFLAYQLDKRIRGSRFYQSIFYIPVVIAPAIISLISQLILFGPEYTWAWLTPGAVRGLIVGAVALWAMLTLTRAMRLALVVVAVTFATVVVNFAPPNPYYVSTVQEFNPGRYLNFNGLTQLLSVAWPFLALLYDMFALAGGERR